MDAEPIRGPGSRAFRPPVVEPAQVQDLKETPDVSFADLVRLLGEGVADAQTELDRASAALVVEFAKPSVDIIPRVEETIDANGTVEYTHAEKQRVSLLDLGVMPTFYQFSEAKVEMAMEIKVMESQSQAPERRRWWQVLFGDPGAVREGRKVGQDVTNAAKLTATLVPVPRPVRLEPVRSTTIPHTVNPPPTEPPETPPRRR